jgi:hypothetical protein
MAELRTYLLGGVGLQEIATIVGRMKSDLGPIFRTFFPGKISGKIPRKIFPQKCWEKN